MDLASILLILAVLILTAAFIVQPFFEKKSHSGQSRDILTATALAQKEHTRSSLLAEKERALNTLQELDFDHSLQKIPEGSYSEQRSALMIQAAGILKQLEDMGYAQEPVTSRLKSDRTDVQEGYDELEELIAQRRGEMKEKNTGFCPRCGKAVKASDRFCPKCGATINAA